MDGDLIKLTYIAKIEIYEHDHSGTFFRDRRSRARKSFRVSPKRAIGAGHPVYIIAEIGINHNGSLAIAKRLIDEAVQAGCDAVKFQKRTPELCTPKDQWLLERDTPWGRMTYINYRHMVELGYEEYAEIDAIAAKRDRLVRLLLG
jgi:sialic acid synthase SpsE